MRHTQIRDVTVLDQGTIVIFQLNTDLAKAFVDMNVECESWQWVGNQGFAVDHRCAGTLIAGMQENGLTVE